MITIITIFIGLLLHSQEVVEIFWNSHLWNPEG